MGGRAILSRISGGGPVDEVESIVAHVRALLNTRVGDSPCAPSLGIADFSDIVHTFPGGIQQLAGSMRATILENEPRLRAVTVRHVPGDVPLVLRFEITAQPVARGTRPLRIATTVRPGGRVDVAG
jgi:type VI secretion system lysozyme-like protein